MSELLLYAAGLAQKFLEKRLTITQTSAKPLEALGLLKMDFLGLTNLTVIQTTLEIIERLHGETIAIGDLPLDDGDTYALLRRGETTGVFQFESAGMRRDLKQLKPSRFEDITAMAALYRPGPMDWIPSFIKRKNGQEEVTYIHPDLEHIFKETYGIGVYQEQILQLARVFAGYSLGEADILRRAIGKKIRKELMAQREKFLAGAKKKGNGKLAEQVFDDIIMPFAGYMAFQGKMTLFGLGAGNPEMQVWIAAIFGALGCNLGSIPAYEVGAWGGHAAVRRFGKYVLLHEGHLSQAHRFFEHFGSWAIIIGRLLPVVRTFIALA